MLLRCNGSAYRWLCPPLRDPPTPTHSARLANVRRRAVYETMLDDDLVDFLQHQINSLRPKRSASVDIDDSV